MWFEAQTVKYILALRKILSKMRDWAKRDFLQKSPTAGWAEWCVLYYFRYPQTVFTTIFLRLSPSHWENAKFLRDLNIIVMLKFYVESTYKHPESNFALFWKSPVTKSFSSLNFLQANFQFFCFEIKMKQKIRMIFFHASCQRWKNI